MQKELNYPVGLQSFSELRKDGYIYIDKTSYIPALMRNGKYKFLSRPRRFGKSLLISMLESFFRGERDLFKGLAIDSIITEEWESHPVIHLDFSGEDYHNTEVLDQKIKSFLSHYEQQLELPNENFTFSERFRNIVHSMHQKFSSKVVVLVDEYDNPITSAIGSLELQERFRRILYGFYSSLKSLDEHLHFCMLTSVSKYGHLSVFSGLNNLSDISLLSEFSGICGITEDELHHFLNSGVGTLAAEEGYDIDTAYQTLKNWYDGYHFSKSLLDVYNPYSIINALARREIADYWYRTGTPTLLIKSLEDQYVDISKLNGIKASVNILDNISAINLNPIALFYQTGYLTIKSYDRESELYTLGFPNKEIESGLMDSILNVYVNIRDSKVLISDLKNYLEKGETENFIKTLRAFFADIPYDLRRNLERYENYYHTIFYVLLRLIGMNVEAEYHTSEGAIDLLIKTTRFIYIIELKINGTAHDAIRQINEHNYSSSFSTDNRKIIKLEIGFAATTHTIDSYLIEN